MPYTQSVLAKESPTTFTMPRLKVCMCKAKGKEETLAKDFKKLIFTDWFWLEMAFKPSCLIKIHVKKSHLNIYHMTKDDKTKEETRTKGKKHIKVLV